MSQGENKEQQGEDYLDALIVHCACAEDQVVNSAKEFKINSRKNDTAMNADAIQSALYDVQTGPAQGVILDEEAKHRDSTISLLDFELSSSSSNGDTSSDSKEFS